MSKGDAFGDNLSAVQYAQRKGILGGPYFGFLPPRYITNCFYRPIGYTGMTTGTSTTANRLYYVPCPVWEDHTFQGASVYNNGAGDNGEKIRLMMFQDDGAAGGPGTLAKDFGEITLTAASAVRTLTSSWSAKRGMYWAGIWHETAAGMYYMNTFHFTTAAGYAMGMLPGHFMGDFGGLAASSATSAFSVGHYVDTAYGAAPATAVAPTSTILAGAASGSAGSTSSVPDFALKA